MKAYYQKRILEFINPAGTSRGVLRHKPCWYFYIYDEEIPSIKGIGEVSVIPGLSIDNLELIEIKLSEVCNLINAGKYDFNKSIQEYPGVSFAIETAFADFKAKGSKILFSSDFTEGKKGILTNGLIWMGNTSEMLVQIRNKIKMGFHCLKMKIGAIGFNDELKILRNIRREFSVAELELRVDANGAFSVEEAKEVINYLAEMDVHSIEQPIMPSQIYEMADLCENTPVPIALDEELIGKHPFENKRKLIEIIHPQYLILKPGLLGGFNESTDYINIAEEFRIGWWITSALESNIGLNAIAQWTASLNTNTYQGLGLGNLYRQNVDCPLTLNGEKLFYDPAKKWSYEFVY
jgi:O-succinylbenzoate synthase